MTIDEEIEPDEDDNASLLQNPANGGNTATPMEAAEQPYEMGGDEVSIVQNWERLYMDDGTTIRSEARLQRCIDQDLAWLEPVRLRPDEMRKCWQYRKVDYVRDHFHDWDWINPRFESRDGISAILPKLSEVNLHGEFLIEARGMSKLATYYVPLGLTKPSCILLFPNRQQMDRQRENDKLVFSSCTDRVERRAAGSNQTNKTQIQWS